MRRSVRQALAGAIVTGVALGPTVSSAAPRPVSADSRHQHQALSEAGLLRRLTSPAGQLTPLPTGTRIVQVSSHDLSGGNVDGGSYEPALAPLLPPTYVRRVGTAFELADQRGPGCLVRIWMTASSGDSGSTASFGNLQLFVDGHRRPVVDEPAASFFGGHDPRFPRPLVNDYVHSSGGNYSYIPFCFTSRLRVLVTGNLTVPLNYFQLTFLEARPGTPVEPFHDGHATARKAAQVLTSAGRPPARPATLSAMARLRPGDQLHLPPVHGPGTVRYLRFKVVPFTIETLRGLTLLVATDRTAKPQVRVPLADVFGDGIETRPIRSLAFGMAPAASTGYLALPIPFNHAMHLSVRSTSARASVSLHAWTTPRAATTRRLYGEQIGTHTRLGRDFPVLAARGSGRLASLVLDLRDPSMPLSGRSPGQWFMEGDERVYVDGQRSPSIYGTGTEDEFNGGFYYNQGAFSLPLSGAGPLGTLGPLEGGTQSQYRVFGDDGAVWSRGIYYGQQDGGNDERLPATATVTTFSYRGPRTLRAADHVTFTSPASRRAHHVDGHFSNATLTAFFEGDRDGTLPISMVAIGGTYYPSLPPDASPEGVTATGIAFGGPVSATLHVPRRNDGVVLRRLQDQQSPAPVVVEVDGRRAGIWMGAAFQGNPLKRWLESDFALPVRLTAGRSRLAVTLRPLHRGETATAYTLRAFVFRAGRG